MSRGRILQSSLLLAGAVVLTCLLAAAAQAARVQWYVEVLTDPISKRPILEARVLTQDGYGFKLMRMNDNSIWGEFSLPRSSEAMLTSDHLPTYRVDSHDPFDLEDLKKLEVGSDPTLYRIEGRSIRFIIWGDARHGFIPPVLRQMMLGETIHVTYYTILGERAEAGVTLRRANQAIAQFLQVRPLNPEADAAEEPAESFALIAKRFQELCDDLRFTGNDSDYTRCRDLFFRCSETPGQDAESFKKCLGFQPRDIRPAGAPPAATPSAATPPAEAPAAGTPSTAPGAAAPKG